MEDFFISKETPLVIGFGGKGRENSVLALHGQGYLISAVLVPDKLSTVLSSSVKVFQKRGIKIIPCAKADLPLITKTYFDHVLVSIGFPYLLSPSTLLNFKLCLNVHPTLLPRYRGPTSLAYIFYNHETEAGATVHVVDEGMDTGPIVLQKKIPITRFDTLRSVQRKVYEIEPRLILDALDLLQDPKFIPYPQDENLASIFPKKRTPEDSMIDPTKPLLDLFDEIRACDPEDFPAYFIIDGQKICIKLWRPNRPPEDLNDMI